VKPLNRRVLGQQIYDHLTHPRQQDLSANSSEKLSDGIISTGREPITGEHYAIIK